MKRRFRKSAARKALFALIVVAAVLALAEAALRIAGFSFLPFVDAANFWDRFSVQIAEESIFETDPELFWRLRPNLGRDMHPDTMDYTTTNEYGYRRPDFQLKKPENTFRVVCAGDSSTFGDMVRDSEAFCAVLGKLLAQRYPGRSFDVVNAGVPGYTSHQVRKRVESELASLKPDVLTVWVGANDSVPAKGDIADKDRPQATAQIAGLRQTLGKLRLYQALNAAILPLKGKAKGKTDKTVLRVEPPDFIENLCAIKRMGDEDGFAVILLTVPHTFDTEQQMNPHVRQAAAQCGANMIDLAKKMKELQLQGQNLYNEDGGHPNVEGHRRIAEMLEESVASLLKFPK